MKHFSEILKKYNKKQDDKSSEPSSKYRKVSGDSCSTSKKTSQSDTSQYNQYGGDDHRNTKADDFAHISGLFEAFKNFDKNKDDEDYEADVMRKVQGHFTIEVYKVFSITYLPS